MDSSPESSDVYIYMNSSDDNSEYLATGSRLDDLPQDELSSTNSVSGANFNLLSSDSSDLALFKNDLVSSDSYETPSLSEHSRQSDESADQLTDIATGPEAAALAFEGAKHLYVEVTLLLVQYSYCGS